MKDVYVIRTPENVSFELELAGVASRALAWVIDLVAMGLLLMIASVVIGALGLVLGELAGALLFMIAFVIQWGYTSLLEAYWGGRTLGKAALGIRVIDERGGDLRFFQVVVRNLLRVVDMLPLGYLVGGIATLLRADGRRLGDLAAGTVVVRAGRSPRPSVVVAMAERYNSFVLDPGVALAARRISAPEREVMLGLALRRDQLPLPIRHRLYGRLAAHLEGRLGIERPDFFSDEKFVLNLTAVVLGASVGYGRDVRDVGNPRVSGGT